MVVAYMSGFNSNGSRGSLTGYEDLFPAVCSAVSSVDQNGYCTSSFPGCSLSSVTGVPECTQIGGGRNGCIPFPVAPVVAKAATMFSGMSPFPQQFEAKSCDERGFPNFSRDLDLQFIRGGLPEDAPTQQIPSTIVGVYGQ